jgi:hypothetical protein
MGSRLLLNLLRGVPDLLWASIAVLAVGLGPAAGVLALALHTAGVLGRLFAETLENADHEAELALRQAGASRLLAFAYGHCRPYSANGWPIPCTAGKTISALPRYWALSVPADWGSSCIWPCRFSAAPGSQSDHRHAACCHGRWNNSADSGGNTWLEWRRDQPCPAYSIF